jgi:hypothetical protein
MLPLETVAPGKAVQVFVTVPVIVPVVGGVLGDCDGGGFPLVTVAVAVPGRW